MTDHCGGPHYTAEAEVWLVRDDKGEPLVCMTITEHRRLGPAEARQLAADLMNAADRTDDQNWVRAETLREMERFQG